MNIKKLTANSIALLIVLKNVLGRWSLLVSWTVNKLARQTWSTISLWFDKKKNPIEKLLKKLQ